MDLAWAFVLAVIAASVILVDRIGGTAELARRLYQLALAAILAFTVMSGTEAFVISDTDGQGILISDSFSGDRRDRSDTGDELLASATIRLGLGLLGIIVGISALRRLRTVPLAVVVGGVFLIVPSGTSGASLSIYQFLAALASQEMRVLHFVFLLGGSLALLWYGFREYEYAIEDDGADEYDALADENGEQ